MTGSPLKILLFLVSTSVVAAAAFQNQHLTTHVSPHFHKTLTTKTTPPRQIKLHAQKPKGVYTRPSAAIERGSGFYIPGLEGSRIRLIFGCLVLLLNYVNGVGAEVVASTTTSSTQTVSEGLTIVYGSLLVLLGAVEVGKEAGFVVAPNSRNEKNTSTKKDLSLVASTSLSDESSEGLNWVGASFISLTSATYVAVVKNDDVVFRLGDDEGSRFSNNNGGGDEAVTAAARSCRETVWASRGGRVSIPGDHPGVAVVPEGARRCVLLQSVRDVNGEECCVVVGSGEVLQAYVKNDLKWLGVLAGYLEKYEL